MPQSSLSVLAETFATRSATRTEADVQFAVAAFLTTAPLGLDESQVARAEVQTADGTGHRIDIAYGRLLIEVKRDLRTPAVLAAAEVQLGGYMRSLSERDGFEYAGILTDGLLWYLYALTVDGVRKLDAFEVKLGTDPESVERLRLWLETILLTGERLRPTQALVAERLGTQSPRFKLDRARLGELYAAQADQPDVQLKRHLWARLLRTALGTNFGDDPELFIDHTLLVLEAEIIAHLVVGLDPSTISPSDILSGETFRQAGIYNVVEEDFFDWPAQTAAGESFIASLVRELSQFNWDDVAHDVLKVLYESVIDATVRKNLGEYYTPDWLAARMVAATVEHPLLQKVMDPACGSGTFLFHSIRLFLAAADDAGMENRDALRLLEDRVFGIDIHPVSAVLARVTYLLAIGRDRLSDRDSLTVPVYLGDSVQWTRAAGSFSNDDIVIEVDSPDLATVVSMSHETLFEVSTTLKFPLSSIDNPGHFDRLMNDLADKAQGYTSRSQPIPSISQLLTSHGVVAQAERATYEETFATLCELNADERDHIWAYFVRNQIRPLWFSSPERRVDVLVGNPPWVAYRFMTDAMQAQFKALAIGRNLWHGGRLTATQDLVALFVARTVEQFLKEDGRFAFVTPHGVLSRMQFEGFRKGRWVQNLSDGPSGTQSVNAAFDVSWDLSGVRPPIFPVPAAVLFGKKSSTAIEMSSQTVQLSGHASALAEASGATTALSGATGFDSPYGKRATQGPTVVPHFMFFVTELPASPLGRPYGTTEVTSARSTQEKMPWKELPSVSGPIEQQFLRKVHAGQTILPFRPLGPSLAVFPVAGDELIESGGMGAFPLLAQRWAQLETLFDANKGKSKMALTDRLNFQKVFAKQLPVPAYRLVYTTSGTRLAAAVLDDTDALINNRLYWVPVASRDEGRYLEAILNSGPFGVAVSKLQGIGLFGARDFHTLPWRMAVPQFDENNAVHAALAALSPRERACVVLRHLDDVSVRDTARLLGISEGAVKRYVSDGVRALSARLDVVAAPEDTAPVLLTVNEVHRDA